MPTFSDLSRAAYCPRQLYYARTDPDRGPPPEAEARQALAFRYDELRAADDETLAALPIDREPAAYREALGELSTRPEWEDLCDPAETEYYVEGKDCHGLIHKLLAGDPPVPTVVSAGGPPETGVWEPQSVRAVAVANALAWERERDIPRALVEYPAVGTVREVELSCRRTAAYRRTLRTVRTMDGPPPRVDDARCESCEYRSQCGVRTRSLKSLLGL
ncbi:MAG: CRISPR-associated protein Cas4 [Natrialbaceae archaeon]